VRLLAFDLSAAAQAFITVFPAELPDKSMIATLALVTKLRNPKAVWVGVAAAFLMHVTIAASIGGLLSRLPTRPIAIVAGLMFTVGSSLMIREAREEADDDDDGIESVAVKDVRGFRAIALTSFGVLAVAELGDLTQFAVAGLSARTAQPLSVGIGGWLAESSVALIAVLTGGWLTKKFHLKKLQFVAAAVFALLAILSFREAFFG
jgi:Ca2+/H+ antiporter, TMEM165/GDT1 family